MAEQKRGIKITPKAEWTELIDDLAYRKAKATGNRNIGSGTIATEMVNRIFEEHSELIREWFGALFVEPDEQQERLSRIFYESGGKLRKPKKEPKEPR